MKNKSKIFIVLIIVSLIYLSITANSAFVLRKSDQLINAYKNDGLIRLHVIANSNTPADQYLKRRVRDKVVNYMAGYSSLEFNDSTLENVKKVVKDTIAENGNDYPVKIIFGNFDFPKRTYGDMTLPAGQYKALRIIIGEGEGSNWWCVLLPPVCFSNQEQVTGQSDIELRLKISELIKNTGKSKLIKVAQKILGI